MIGFRQMDRPKKSLKFDPDFTPSLSLKYGTEGGGGGGGSHSGQAEKVLPISHVIGRSSVGRSVANREPRRHYHSAWTITIVWES